MSCKLDLQVIYCTWWQACHCACCSWCVINFTKLLATSFRGDAMLMSWWLFWSSSVTTSSHDLISQLQRHLTQSTIEELKVKAKIKMLNQLGCKLFAAPACQHLGSSGQPANWRIINELSQNWNLYTDFFLYYMPTQWPDLIDPHATDNSEVTCEARRRQPSSHHKEKTREELLIVAI